MTGLCTYPALADGTECEENGNHCTTDVCHGGKCMHEPNDGVPCQDDKNLCTNDVCSGGECTHPPNDGAPCLDDENVCTNDVCSGEECTHPPNDGVPGHDDGNPCTSDVCDGGTCLHEPKPDCCFDKKTFGDVNALCVENCGAGNGTNCKTVCEYFGVPYVSPKQCHDAGSAKDALGVLVVGNKICKANPPEPRRTNCCTCDKFTSGVAAVAPQEVCRGLNRRCNIKGACCCNGLKCSTKTKRCKAL